MVPFTVTLNDPLLTYIQGHAVIRPINALDVLCAQLTRDLFAIAKFLYIYIIANEDVSCSCCMLMYVILSAPEHIRWHTLSYTCWLALQSLLSVNPFCCLFCLSLDVALLLVTWLPAEIDEDYWLTLSGECSRTSLPTSQYCHCWRHVT